MKKISLLTVVALGIFALISCGNTAEKANTGTVAVKVDELVNSAIADKDAWMGKEVAVTGYVGAYTGSGGALGYRITLKNEAGSQSKNGVFCTVPQGDVPKELVGKTVEVKGKFQSVESSEYIWVKLDPCELKK